MLYRCAIKPSNDQSQKLPVDATTEQTISNIAPAITKIASSYPCLTSKSTESHVINQITLKPPIKMMSASLLCKPTPSSNAVLLTSSGVNDVTGAQLYHKLVSISQSANSPAKMEASHLGKVFTVIPPKVAPVNVTTRTNQVISRSNIPSSLHLDQLNVNTVTTSSKLPQSKIVVSKLTLASPPLPKNVNVVSATSLQHLGPKAAVTTYHPVILTQQNIISSSQTSLLKANYRPICSIVPATSREEERKKGIQSTQSNLSGVAPTDSGAIEDVTLNAACKILVNI